jgi:hypothetical protein
MMTRSILTFYTFSYSVVLRSEEHVWVAKPRGVCKHRLNVDKIKSCWIALPSLAGPCWYRLYISLFVEVWSLSDRSNDIPLLQVSMINTFIRHLAYPGTELCLQSIIIRCTTASQLKYHQAMCPHSAMLAHNPNPCFSGQPQAQVPEDFLVEYNVICGLRPQLVRLSLELSIDRRQIEKSADEVALSWLAEKFHRNRYPFLHAAHFVLQADGFHHFLSTLTDLYLRGWSKGHLNVR